MTDNSYGQPSSYELWNSPFNVRRFRTSPASRPFEKPSERSETFSHNLHRRHLSESQRAMVAAKIANLEHGSFHGNQSVGANLPTPAISNTAAADMLNVSERSVKSARREGPSKQKEPRCRRLRGQPGRFLSRWDHTALETAILPLQKN